MRDFETIPSFVSYRVITTKKCWCQTNCMPLICIMNDHVRGIYDSETVSVQDTKDMNDVWVLFDWKTKKNHNKSSLINCVLLIIPNQSQNQFYLISEISLSLGDKQSFKSNILVGIMTDRLYIQSGKSTSSIEEFSCFNNIIVCCFLSNRPYIIK